MADDRRWRLAKQDNNRELLLQAIREVTGKQMRIGVKRGAPVAAAAEPAPQTPIDAFLRRSEQLGVTVEEKDG